ncbi:MAG: sugar phosphate isomerase/epimerase, partial [Acholeplasmatales bacterium]|nr:sugar phosphate isomerase/epimerase [Acholeplasmatales bacterium]
MKYYIIPNKDDLDKYIKLANKYNLGFEYNDFYDPEFLDNGNVDNLINIYKSLNRKDDTMHGVFYDIVLDSTDPKIAKISYDRVKSSLDIAAKLNLKGVVFHTNYITWMKNDWYRKNWVKKNKDIYLKLIEEYPNLEIYIENMFDLDPYELRNLMDEINHERIGVCLDVAHASISNIDINIWFDVLGKYIKHIHINDNDLKVDSHDEIGKGLIDYKKVFNLINKLDDKTSILIEIKDYDKTVNS